MIPPLTGLERRQQRGVEFTEGIADHGYGLVTHFKMPGGVDAQLYQPSYSKKKR